MVRVARIITRLNIGGPAIQAVTLADRLRDHGFETLLIHGRLGPAEGDMSYLLEGRNVRTAYVPHLQRAVAPADDLRALRAVYRLIDGFRPDIVHTHTAKAGTIGRTAALAHRRLRGGTARTVHTYHGHVLDGYFRFAGAFVAVERALARTTDRLIAVSPYVARDLQERHRIGRPDQWTVVPLGFDLSPFAAIDESARAAARSAEGLVGPAPIVTIVGRLTAIKQHELFLQAARGVLDREPTARFRIVGDGERRAEIEAMAAGLGLAGAVRFEGWRHDLPRVYAATDVCVLTSRNEGTPVALIEALASGVPVVSTEVGGVGDVVNDPRLGATVPDGDTAGLADRIVDALAPERRRAGDAAARRASVLARYGFDRLAADVASLYRRVLEA